MKRKAGWDTHGLPVELGVEKELGITKEDIGKTISIERLQPQVPYQCDDVYSGVDRSESQDGLLG